MLVLLFPEEDARHVLPCCKPACVKLPFYKMPLEMLLTRSPGY